MFSGLILLVGAMIALPPGGPLVIPGQGYGVQPQSLRELCVDGDRVYVGSAEAGLHLDRQLSDDELNQLTEATFAGGVDLFILSGKVETSVSSKLRAREYRETLVYTADYRGKSLLLNNPRLTALGEVMKASEDAELQALNCGSEYVSALHLGGHLDVLVDFYFKDKQSLDNFRTTITLSFLGIKSVKTITKRKEFRDGIARVQISAQQQGGERGALDQLLAPLERSCPLDQFDRCAETLDKVADYALNRFPQQLETGMSVLGFETKSMQEFGFPARRSLSVNDGGLRALADLLAVVNEDRRLFLQDALLYARWSTRLAALNTFEQGIWLDTRDQVLRGLNDCERGACPSSAAVAGLKKAYESRRSVLTRDADFLDYCEQIDRGRDLDRSTNALLAVWNYRGRSLEACETVANHLQTVRSLPLADQNLKTLLPLKNLTQLEALDLGHNALELAYPLGTLTGLRSLNLRFNAISDIFDLRHLHLLDLDVSYNRIDAQGRFPGVQRTLLAHGNLLPPGTLKPVAGLTLIDTESALCAWQRQALYESGMISRGTYLAYEQADFLPVLIDDRLDIKPCPVGAPVFDSVRAGLFPDISLSSGSSR